MKTSIKPERNIKQLLDIPIADIRSPKLESNEVEKIHDNLWAISNVLTPRECTAIINHSEPALSRSTTIPFKMGEKTVSDFRTSNQTWLKPDPKDGSYLSSIVLKMKERVSYYTNLPIVNQEDLQVLRYEHGQQYKGHYDFFDRNSEGFLSEAGKSGQRLFTAYFYLNQVDSGGETFFPRKDVSVIPETGKLVVWRNFVKGKPDRESMHWGKPPNNCVKWGATIWIREASFLSMSQFS